MDQDNALMLYMGESLSNKLGPRKDFFSVILDKSLIFFKIRLSYGKFENFYFNPIVKYCNFFKKRNQRSLSQIG